jgi:hypothetical protein
MFFFILCLLYRFERPVFAHIFEISGFISDPALLDVRTACAVSPRFKTRGAEFSFYIFLGD